DETAVDHDEAVAEHARCEHRQRDQLAPAGREARDELGRRELAEIELEPCAHPIEDHAWIVFDQEIQIDPLNSDLAGVERQHPVIEAASKSQRYLGHHSPLCAPRALDAGITTLAARPEKS